MTSNSNPKRHPFVAWSPEKPSNRCSALPLSNVVEAKPLDDSPFEPIQDGGCDATLSNDPNNGSVSEGTVQPQSMTEDEKFELLSAYLDGEVSGQACQLVEHWLASDPQIRCHYQAQLKLRQAIQGSFSS